MEKHRTWWSPLKKYFDLGQRLLLDPNYAAPTCYTILLLELVLNYCIVEYVAYTEIDWRAYMQEVGGFLNGTLDYKQLKGDTGPCVYPAGFLYIYSVFYYLTDHGTDIRRAQYIFIGVYLLQTHLTYSVVLKTCKIPPIALWLSFATSYRIHSIYVLRLFNDPIAVVLFWAALNAWLAGRWKTGSVLFSLAVSVKMNILLYAPCLLLAYLANLPRRSVVVNLAICAGVQLLVGLPFLLTHPESYIERSFNLGRVFQHRWSVNYRFMDKATFRDPRFHIALLVVHVSLLALFAPLMWKYFKAYYTLRKTIVEMRENTTPPPPQPSSPPVEAVEEPLTKEQQEFLDAFEKQMKGDTNKPSPPVASSKKKTKKKKAPTTSITPQEEKSDTYEINFAKISQLFVLPFFVTNLIGIACARSLHYQFYAWYFHALLYIVYSTPWRKPLGFLMLGLLETSWNVYPSTEWSSGTLHFVHVFLLYGVYKTMRG